MPLDSGLKLKQNDDQLLIAGWGTTESLFKSQSLLKAQIPKQSLQKCIDTFKLEFITDTNIICAGGEKQVDACKGDSGGPLFWTERVNSGSKYIQHGITASGYIHCGALFRSKTPPALYTNVFNYIDWIKSNMH